LKKEVKYSKPTTLMVDRMARIFLVFAFLFLLVIGRVFYVQVICHEDYEQMALDQMLKDTTISAKRGTIYDANMKVLSQSATVWTIAIDPNMMKNYYKGSSYESKKAEVCKKLSEILELDYEKLLEKASSNVSYVEIKKKIDAETMTNVSAYKKENDLTYLMIFEDSKRYYPYENLASTVLGFVNADGVGAYGLEAQYENILAGKSGRIVSARDATQGEMPYEYEMMIDSEAGNNLVLTIDEVAQHYLEKHLRQAVEDYEVVNGATGIIMNVNTGAVLAMASLPDYNCNDPYTVTGKYALQEINSKTTEEEKKEETTNQMFLQWRNKAIYDTYEPGSVFKPITCSACLEEGIVSLNESFNCTGNIRVASENYHCHKAGGHGTQDLTHGMMNSCNPFFINMGQRLGVSKFYEYMDAFGLTEKTGIDLPNERSSIIHSENNRGIVELASSSFGQSFQVTPIQLATAIAATVNGGYLVQPHVVSKIIDGDGNIVESKESNIKRQVISAETSEAIATMLEKVVSEGTGKNAYLEGYRIGGKTGTSEKINETNISGIRKYVASFCAIAPADDPEIVVLVALDEPMGNQHMGGQIAAPTVKNILEDVLPYLGIEPIYSEDDMQALDLYAPDVIDSDVESAKQTIEAAGLKARVIGDGTTIVRQVPAEGNVVPKDGTVIIYTDGTDSNKTTTVPDFSGMTPAQANSAAANANLNIRFSGADGSSSTAYASGQSIAKDTVVDQGTVITVEFMFSDIVD